MAFNIEKLKNGNLKITVEEGISDSDKGDMIDFHYVKGDYATLIEYTESYSTNGSYTVFDGADGNPFVGLADAICIAESMNHDDADKMTIEGDFWYYPDSAISDPVQKIFDDGFVIFVKG